MSDERLRVVVLISGGGTNLQAIIDATSDGELPIDLVGVISNRADAFGLERARRADVATRVLDHHDFPDRDGFDQAMIELIDGLEPGLIVLAGFMRILTPAFVRHYQGRMINIHPSLLPKFRGLHTHRRALEAGETEHGASVHFVTEELDGGPLIVQTVVPVNPDDDETILAARVLEREHVILPLVIRLFAEECLHLAEDGVWLDGERLLRPLEI